MIGKLHKTRALLGLASVVCLLFSVNALAECGSKQECIAVSTDPAVLPTHGTPAAYVWPLPFGQADIGAATMTKSILVRAVTGPAGTEATIQSITISGANPEDFSVSNGTCIVGVPSLLQNSTTPCEIQVTFTPTASGSRSAEVRVSTSLITRIVGLTGEGVLPPPTITSPQSATGQVGVAFNYPITGSFQPTSFGATPLPDGLAVDSSTGIISGTPTTDGITDVTISATNASGTGSATLRITVSLLAPVITSGDSVSLTADEFFSGYTIAATNDPDSFGATDLPPGLTVDPTTGVVSGIATAAGAFAASVSATNATATASKVVTFNVAAVPPSGETGAVTAQLNSPTTIDFDALTSGTGVDQVRIVRQPAHGRLTLSGLQGTYTPAANYFGADSFTYAAVSGQTESPPAKVTIEVVGRPDPTQDADTRALQRAQIDTAKRVSRAQIANVQRRLETLHNRRAAASRPTRAAGPVADRSPASSADSPLSENVGGAALAAGDSVGDSTSTVGSPLLAALANVAQSGSMTLDGDYTGSSGALAGVSVWVGGNVGFGTRDAAYGSSKLRFTSDGISAGVDKMFNESLVLGLAFGYAKDQAEIGAEDSSNDTDFWSVSAYGSYQPAPQFFIDGMLGYGHLDYDSRRYVAAFDADAFSDRNGDQLFGSVAVSYEYRRDRLLLSPYGRVDFAFTWLDSSTETGAGQAALHYFSQDFDSAQLALGFRAESAHEMSYGWVIPRLRLEYLRQFESDRRQSIAYADQLAGQRFWLLSPDSNENSLLIGAGTDFDLNNGVRLGFDYQTIQASGHDEMQAFGLWLSKSFDQVWNPWSLFGPRTFRNPVRVEAGFMWDENLNRAPIDGDKIADKLYSISVQQRFVRPLTNKIRVVATGVLGGTKLHKNDGLDNIMGEARGELQYRTSGHFLAPTFGAYAKIRGEEFSSKLRSGYRYAFGVNARQALSDRLGAFAAVERNVREGDSEVFENRDWAARMHFDYALGRWGFAYVGGEFRHGDVVTSIDGGDAYEGGVAEVIEDDDAYYNQNLVAARVDAETWMANAGYNFPLGPRDSLDFSWRWVISTPDRYAEPDAHGGPADGGGSYITNQISAAYLLRF